MPAGVAVHRRDPPAAAVTGSGGYPGNAAPPPPPAPGTPAWRVALSLFTVIPAGVGSDLDEGAAVRAVFWLPVLGAGLGLAGSAVMVFVAAGELSAERQFLGAALAVALLAVATGGLHLDGLADTADGLGSRRPADQALEIMRRSDAGPLGIATLVLVLLVQVSALASLPRGWAGRVGGRLDVAGRGRLGRADRAGAGRGDQPGGGGAGHRLTLGPAVRFRRPGGRADQRRGPGGQRGDPAGRGGRGRAGPGRGGGRGPGRGRRGGRPGRGRRWSAGPRGGGWAG